MSSGVGGAGPNRPANTEKADQVERIEVNRRAPEPPPAAPAAEPGARDRRRLAASREAAELAQMNRIFEAERRLQAREAIASELAKAVRAAEEAARQLGAAASGPEGVFAKAARAAEDAGKRLGELAKNAKDLGEAAFADGARAVDEAGKKLGDLMNAAKRTTRAALADATRAYEQAAGRLAAAVLRE